MTSPDQTNIIVSKDELQKNQEERNEFRRCLAHAEQLNEKLQLVDKMLHNWQALSEWKQLDGNMVLNHSLSEGNIDTYSIMRDYQKQICQQLDDLQVSGLMETSVLIEFQSVIIELLRKQRKRLEHECSQVFTNTNYFYSGDL